MVRKAWYASQIYGAEAWMISDVLPGTVLHTAGSDMHSAAVTMQSAATPQQSYIETVSESYPSFHPRCHGSQAKTPVDYSLIAGKRNDSQA